MTTVYNDYYTAYENGDFDINNVNFITKLMMDTYVPDVTHKRNDNAFKNHVIMTAGNLSGNPLTTMAMSEIMTQMKQNIKDDIASNPSSIFEELDVMFADDLDKQVQLKMAFSNIDINDFDYWNRLKELGVMYIVVLSINLNVLCFCEPL